MGLRHLLDDAVGAKEPKHTADSGREPTLFGLRPDFEDFSADRAPAWRSFEGLRAGGSENA